MSTVPRRAFLGALYLVALAAFFEAGSRLALSNPELFERVTRTNADAAWRLRWLARQKDGPRLYYRFDVHHPSRGWAVRPHVRETGVWGSATLTTNARGLRGGRDHDYAKPPGRTRIVTLGDSFTFGDEVSDEETWPHQLEQLTPGVEVLNLGVHGYGHDQMLLYLREEGVRYAPDVVLLGFLSDDMERNVIGFRDYAKPRFDLDSGALRLRNVPIPPPEVLSERVGSRFLDLLSLVWVTYEWRSGRTSAFTRELTTAILDAIAETARSSGAVPVYAYLPVYGEIDKPDPSMTRRERFFFDYCSERGIDSVYLRPHFLPRVRAGVELKTHGHWGPLEHRIAAEGIRDRLLELGLVPAARSRHSGAPLPRNPLGEPPQPARNGR